MPVATAARRAASAASRRAASTAAIALLVGACGGPAEITPNPDLTPAPAPAGWTEVAWTDPGLSIALPGGWTTADPRATFAPDPSLSADQRRNIEFGNEMASSGKTRLFAYGDVATVVGNVSSGAVFVYVETGDASLGAFADREAELDRTLIPGLAAIDRSTVVVPAGVAIRLAYDGAIGDWPAFSEVDYLFRLGDGRSLMIGLSGNDRAANAGTIGPFASLVIATLQPAR